MFDPVPCGEGLVQHVDLGVSLLCASESQRGLRCPFSCLVAPQPHSPLFLISAVGSNPI